MVLVNIPGVLHIRFTLNTGLQPLGRASPGLYLLDEHRARVPRLMLSDWALFSAVVFMESEFTFGSFSCGYGSIKGIELAKMFLFPVHLDLSDPFIPPLFEPYT